MICVTVIDLHAGVEWEHMPAFQATCMTDLPGLFGNTVWWKTQIECKVRSTYRRACQDARLLSAVGVGPFIEFITEGDPITSRHERRCGRETTSC